MTLLQALTRLHALLEGDTETPLSGDDYTLRVELLNDAVEEWASQPGVRWRELYTTDDSLTGDGLSSRFDLPADFLAFNGSLYIQGASGGRTEVGPVTTGRGIGTTNNGIYNSWIEGRKLVLNFTPANTETLVLPYYAAPALLTSNTDLLPMSRPRYAIYYALARLTEQSGDYTRYNSSMQKAEELMTQMKIDNDALGEGVLNQVVSTMPGLGI